MMMPHFNIGKYRLRPETLKRMSMEFLCSIPVEPGTAALDDLEFDLKLSDRVLKQIVDWLWKNHEVSIKQNLDKMLCISKGPMWSRARTLALDYWEKTYGKEEEENDKAAEQRRAEREDTQEENVTVPNDTRVG